MIARSGETVRILERVRKREKLLRVYRGSGGSLRLSSIALVVAFGSTVPDGYHGTVCSGFSRLSSPHVVVV
jgi:hypothetical protein